MCIIMHIRPHNYRYYACYHSLKEVHIYTYYSLYIHIFGDIFEYLSKKFAFFVNIILAFPRNLLYSGFRFEI